MGGVIPAREPNTMTDDGPTSGEDYKLAWKAQVSDPLYSTDEFDDLERFTRAVKHGDDPKNMMHAAARDSVMTDDSPTSGEDYKLAWKAQVSDPLYSTVDDDDFERFTRAVKHGDDPNNMMQAARDSIRVAPESRDESEIKPALTGSETHTPKADVKKTNQITTSQMRVASGAVATASAIEDELKKDDVRKMESSGGMVMPSELTHEDLKMGSKIQADGGRNAEALDSGKIKATLSKTKNSLKVDAMPSMANTQEAGADMSDSPTKGLRENYAEREMDAPRHTAIKKISVQSKKKTIDDEMVKTLKMEMSHKLNSSIGKTLSKDLAMEKSYDAIPEGAANLETLVHIAEMADMRAAIKDMKSTMSAISKKMFPARHAEAKGPVQPARITTPRSDSSLVGAAHVASAAALDSKPTLDPSAALLRDSESTSNSKHRRWLVADDELVSLNEDTLMKDPSMTHDDSTLAKGIPIIHASPIVVKLFQDAKMSIESTDVPSETIESTETPSVETAFTEAPAEGTAYTEAPDEGIVYTEAPAGNEESTESVAEETESTVSSANTAFSEAPEVDAVSNQELTTLLPIDSQTMIPTTDNTIGLEPTEVQNAPPIIIIVDGEKEPVAVSNVHPKKKPKYSDSHLPALVQILTHLIEELDLKEISMNHPVTESPSVEKPAVTQTPAVDARPEDAAGPALVTGTTPSVIPVVATSPNTGSDGSSGVTIVQLTIPNLTLGDKPSESLVIEVIPVAKNTSAMAVKKKLKASDTNDDLDDDVEDMQEDMPVVQHDVPIVNEETVPMTMVINMVPSDEHDMMVDDAPEREALFYRNVEKMEEFDELIPKEEIAKSPAARPKPTIRAPSPPLTRHTRQDDSATKQAPLTDMAHPDERHRYVYYPTLFFTDTWQRSPGNVSGYLGFNEALPAMKDHVDLEEETALKDTADDALDERRSEFDDLKDNGFLLTAIREVETNVTERPPPSPELKTLVKLRFHLSTDAKKQGLAKYQGFSDALIKELAETNNLTGREQFVVVLKKVLANGEITSSRTIYRAQDVLEEVENVDSALSKSLEGIPALRYL